MFVARRRHGAIFGSVMSKRSRLCLFILAALCVANLGYRLWASWGLISIDANGTPLSTVVANIQRQAGIRLRTNLPADTTVTMHVRKASLVHALEVLSATTNSSWNVSYFTAPDKGSIETALTSLAANQQPEGWQRFSFGGPRGVAGEFEQGVADPRIDPWKPKPAPEGTLHAYLQQAALMTSAQFWAPEQWNPAVPRPPKEGEVRNSVASLAKTVRGTTAEVFFLRGRPQMAAAAEQDTDSAGADRPTRGERGDRGNRTTMTSDEMRKAMEERALAQIDRLPKDQRAAAIAQLDERRKFWEELAQLSPEERRAKMAEHMEQVMNSPDAAARMESGSTKRSAMQTADQRAQRYKGYLDRKRAAMN